MSKKGSRHSNAWSRAPLRIAGMYASPTRQPRSGSFAAELLAQHVDAEELSAVGLLGHALLAQADHAAGAIEAHAAGAALARLDDQSGGAERVARVSEGEGARVDRGQDVGVPDQHVAGAEERRGARHPSGRP